MLEPKGNCPSYVVAQKTHRSPDDQPINIKQTKKINNKNGSVRNPSELPYRIQQICHLPKHLPVFQAFSSTAAPPKMPPSKPPTLVPLDPSLVSSLATKISLPHKPTQLQRAKLRGLPSSQVTFWKGPG